MRFLIDLRTGEPAIDYDGNMVQIDIERAFNQYLDVLLHTQILQEVLLPTWGLDIRGIIESSAFANWESAIKYLIADALSPRKEPLIDDIKEIEVDRDGNILNVNVSVTSTFGTTANPTVSVNE